MSKMKRQWKRIISTIMAVLMVITVIPNSLSSSSAAETATPGDADQAGYVRIEAKLPESGKKGEIIQNTIFVPWILEKSSIYGIFLFLRFYKIVWIFNG